MLIELRVKPSYKVRGIMKDVKGAVKIRKGKIERIPHLTLYGGFKAPRWKTRDIIEAVKRIGRVFGPVRYNIDGYDHMDNSTAGHVVTFKIIPSKELDRLRLEIAKEMRKIAPSGKTWDSATDFWYHITIANHVGTSDYKKIWGHLNGIEPDFLTRLIAAVSGRKIYGKHLPVLPSHGLRITLLNDQSRIICEYDLVQHRVLNRREALSKGSWRETYKVYRKIQGQEIDKQSPTRDSGGVYLISDTHLDHDNIIRYCSRPFVDSREMNSVIMKNWNLTVGPNDTVYFLGDLVFGKSSRGASFWLPYLGGKKILIEGNHDMKSKGFKEYEILRYKEREFLLVHDPKKLPIKWDKWVIHGHTHNNDLRRYPFINGRKKTINVSAELINYRPISIDMLISLDLDTIDRMDTLSSEPIRLARGGAKRS